jgi:hypothetical protein
MESLLEAGKGKVIFEELAFCGLAIVHPLAKLGMSRMSAFGREELPADNR